MRLRSLVAGVVLGLSSSQVLADAHLARRLAEGLGVVQASPDHSRTGLQRVGVLARVIEQLPDDGDLKSLQAVNAFFNQADFVPDEQAWGEPDYWASPAEFLARNAGDCEDFALAKYFALLSIGIPAERMRITYVNALELGQAHMVLAYYSRPGADPLVLDNLTSKILPLSQRPDLQPVYSFNGLGLWLKAERDRERFLGSPTRLSRWVELNQRMAHLNR